MKIENNTQKITKKYMYKNSGFILCFHSKFGSIVKLYKYFLNAYISKWVYSKVHCRFVFLLF